MNYDFLLAQFDRISDAPEAVPRLRRFILHLAVRGKLVEPDSNDGTASELLKLIQAERSRLAASEEIKKEKPLAPIDENEVPFALPAQWSWARLRQITSDRGQATPSGEFSYIDVTSINKEDGRVGDTRVLSASEAPSRARKVVAAGDVVYSCVRPYLLNVAIIDANISPLPIASTAFAVLNGYGLILPRYIWIVMRSPFMVECVEKRMRGQAYPAINDSDFALLPFPVPPLAEQQRIVAKVDELMALCDRLEAAQTERERRRDLLVSSSLHRVNQAADSPASLDHARFYLSHLPRLTTRPDQIPALRGAILNLAVHGRLVPQDSNDEPASELLTKVQKERASEEPFMRDREGLATAPCIDDLFPIPDNWRWTTLGELAFSFRYGTSVKCSYEVTGVPVLRIPNVADGKIDIGDLKYGSLPKREVELLTLRAGDILVVRSNGSLSLVGRVALVGSEAVGYCYAGYLVRIRASVTLLDGRYLLLALTTKHVRDQIEIPIRTTVGLKNVNATELARLSLPLPPLAEQHRIVAKVDELMALCDRLESQLAAAQKESSAFLEAVLHEALSRVAETLKAEASG
jgi:type I restriction enzyme S subunit